MTKKPIGLRMGKGCGKPTIWFSLIKPGFIWIEFKGIRIGKISYFNKKFNSKLNSKLFIVSS